ncbi:transglutaminase family protein [Zooshikella harenae]|uniref:DUF3488 domain-containing transglutaminase family protein n=1 Tax=Zooshikella harenae TaxID=2827238 RepID=A0ABS5ZJ92_9GAMM|nr:DUF3488 and transglutaminase-like domain-containing protein [Zooshikella harenae]MBU2713067.1 DUF3488 domain-containing transglutaminase family protein [Zooshikella harenae]
MFRQKSKPSSQSGKTHNQRTIAVASIPRTSLIWLFTTQALVLLPHLLRIPYWVGILAVVCGCWRIMIFNGRWSYPARWLKALLVIGAVTGTFLNYGTIVGLEAGVVLLLCTFLLKLLEMKNQRDAYLVVFLSYFVIVTQLLYSQAIPSAAYTFFTLVVITSALVGLHQQQGTLELKKTLRKGAVMMLQAVPLMVLLFIFIPRLGPIWSVELPSQKARSGVSDQMTPGDIAELSKSDALAFRATFTDTIPPQNQLYWRGIVLSELMGRTWRQASRELTLAGRTGQDLKLSGNPLITWRDQFQRWPNAVKKQGQALNYTVILEPTQQNWLYALAVPQISNVDIGVTRDFTLIAREPVRLRQQYKVRSYPSSLVDVELPHWLRRQNVQLSAFGNPKTRTFAQQLWDDVEQKPQLYIDRILQYFNRQPFYYTLKPPTLGFNSVDEFLFTSRRGFCAHYASTFVYLMRIAGIPARVIAGYQGGERNTTNNYVQVRQFDAHAWAEVWLEDKGWVRVDPTASVAPERIQDGLEAALAEEGSFLEDTPLSPIRFKHIGWINRLRLEWDMLEYRWQRFVLNYNQDQQMEFFNQLFGTFSWYKLALALGGGLGAIIIMLGVWIIFRRQPIKYDPATRLYLKFCQWGRKQGCQRLTGETPIHYLQRLQQHVPYYSAWAQRVTDNFVTLQYNPDFEEGESLYQKELVLLKKLVRHPVKSPR